MFLAKLLLNVTKICDYAQITSGFLFKNYYNSFFFFTKKIFIILNFLDNKRKYFLKKYFYTINHKRIAINYFFFSMWSGLSGAALATMIRLELAYPGSPFFKGDSLRYLQVITAHGLIMVFLLLYQYYLVVLQII